MTEDKGSTSADHLKGSVAEAIGKLTGDAQAQAEGQRRKRGARPSRPGGAKTKSPDRA
jgi:uncharacterized protein YjbJ (UPF0337 family)